MASPTLHLRSIDGLHIGGEILELRGIPARDVVGVPANPPRRSDQNGFHAAGQLYVQRFLLAEPMARFPLLFWHGGGLTGACWETTPDGRPGWHDFFMRAGHDTFVSDASERGRASWARYPEINTELPEHRPLDLAWGMFRIGPPGGYHPDPEKRISFPGSLFPAESADQLLKQFVARWTTREADRRAEAAYHELVQRTGNCVVLAHSQGGFYAFNVAARQQSVCALVCIEPVVPLLEDYDPAALKGRPVLVVLGDNRPDNARRDAFISALIAADVRVDVLDLPARNVTGNSHMLMMDRNSDDIAAMIQAWLAASGLMK